MPLIIELGLQIFLLVLQNIKALDLLQLVFREADQVIQQTARFCDISNIGLPVGLEELDESIISVSSQMKIELIFWFLLSRFISEHVVWDLLTNIRLSSKLIWRRINAGIVILDVYYFLDALVLNGRLSRVETSLFIWVQNELVIVVK